MARLKVKEIFDFLQDEHIPFEKWAEQEIVVDVRVCGEVSISECFDDGVKPGMDVTMYKDLDEELHDCDVSEINTDLSSNLRMTIDAYL